MRLGLLLAHVVSTLVMVGVIWMVQVVHYPLFARVGAEGFVGYQAAHSARITALIALPWAVQGVTGLVLVAARPAGVPVWIAVADLCLVGVTVLVTVALSVPAHEVLGAGFDAGAIRTLVTTNWLRTAAWTGSGVLSVAMLVAAIGASGRAAS